MAPLTPDGFGAPMAGDPRVPEATVDLSAPGEVATGGEAQTRPTAATEDGNGAGEDHRLPAPHAGGPPGPPSSPPDIVVGPGRDVPASRRRRRRRWLVEWAIILVIAVVVAFVVRTFVAQTFYIPSTSMYPTLKAGNRIVVNKLAFDFGSIQRGDIIVFRRPPAEDCGGPPVPDLVKRVIGLPGNTVSAKNGHVYITGKELKEPWLPATRSRTYTAMHGSYKVPPNDYFVMGDNRVNSCDSRMWGPVKRTYIVGKVDLIIWPLGTFHFF